MLLYAFKDSLGDISSDTKQTAVGVIGPGLLVLQDQVDLRRIRNIIGKFPCDGTDERDQYVMYFSYEGLPTHLWICFFMSSRYIG